MRIAEGRAAARARTVALAVLLATPFVLAFHSGGYFDEPRLWASLTACAALLVAAAVARRPVPRSLAGRLALAGLTLLAAWTVASTGWAPLSSYAVPDADRLLFYAAYFAAAVALLDTRAAARAIEPVLAGGALVVVCYGLSERFLPGIVHIQNDASAFGRLSRPLTYWNAMGTVAALGSVAAVRLAGDATRPRGLRTAGAAATPVLGLALYLTFSRGALVAAGVGLLVVYLLAPGRSQLRSLGIGVAAGVLASAAAGASKGVRALEGSLAGRERAGALVLVAVVALALLAALAQALLARREGAPAAAAGRAEGGRRLRVGLALLAVAVVGGVTLASQLAERRPRVAASGARSTRLTSVESTRSAYWRVAFRMFEREPIRGEGSGSFAVAWLRERTVPEAARDAHSLYFETAAELGLVGVAALAIFLGGTLAGARRAYARDPVAAAGLAAVLAVWIVHAGLDWLWEFPAVSLPVLGAAAALARGGDPPAEAAELGP